MLPRTKDTIISLEKASGAGGGDNYETITYEGYGPGGVAVIVETMTAIRKSTLIRVGRLQKEGVE